MNPRPSRRVESDCAGESKCSFVPGGRRIAGGGQVLNGPMEVPGGDWIINGIDPQGAPFSLVAAEGD